MDDEASTSAGPSHATDAEPTRSLSLVPPKPSNNSVFPITQSVCVPAIISHGKSLVYGTTPGADSLYPTGSSATHSPGLESVISSGGGAAGNTGDVVPGFIHFTVGHVLQCVDENHQLLSC